MPIEIEQFETQFLKLQASFGTVKPAKIIEEWFKEFEDEDYFTFVKAIKKCQYGDRFPNWAVFKAELRNAQGMTGQEAFKGCGECHGGVVLFRDVNKNNEVTDQAANCAECSLNKTLGMANVFPKKLHKDDFDILRTRRALEKDVEKGARIANPKQVQPQNPIVIAKKVFGADDPENEKKRYGSLKREEMREALL